MEQNQVVTPEQWLAARKQLLGKEKELTRLRDQLTSERLRLPWVRVQKEDVFDGPAGKLTLSDLFQGRSQLYIKHFMMGPGAQHQCVGCSLEVDHIEGLLPHLENHDVSYAVVARAPIEEIEVVRKRMNWKFLWVSSFNNDFSYDFHVSFKEVHAGRAQYNFQTAPDWTADFQDLAGGAYFTRTREARSFTLTQRTLAAARKCSGFTASSTLCRKGGTRQDPIIHWLIGRVRTMCMARAATLKLVAAITHRAATLRLKRIK